jgi:hypothetical protein
VKHRHRKRIVWPLFGAFLICCLVSFVSGLLSVRFFFWFYELLDLLSLFYAFVFGLLTYVASYAVFLFVKDKLWLSSRSIQERDRIRNTLK